MCLPAKTDVRRGYRLSLIHISGAVGREDEGIVLGHPLHGVLVGRLLVLQAAQDVYKRQHQMVVSGAGDIQIDVLVSKLKTRFGVDAELDTPRVPYREKIRKTVQKQGRHKKQTGGSGQFRCV